jgi:hypothetical protein
LLANNSTSNTTVSAFTSFIHIFPLLSPWPLVYSDSIASFVNDFRDDVNHEDKDLKAEDTDDKTPLTESDT